MAPDDPAAAAARASIAAVLDANLAGPADLLGEFESMRAQLAAADGAGSHLEGWLARERSLEETAAEIDRLLQVQLARQ